MRGYPGAHEEEKVLDGDQAGDGAEAPFIEGEGGLKEDNPPEEPEAEGGGEEQVDLYGGNSYADAPLEGMPDYPDFGGFGGRFGMEGLGMGGGRYRKRENPDPDLETEVETQEVPIDEAVIDDPVNQLQSATPMQLKSVGYKVILLWTSEKLTKHIPLGISPFSDAKCPKDHCVVTRDREFLTIADAVMLSAEGGNQEMPDVRFPQQKWILFSPEVMTSGDVKYSEKFLKTEFNLTYGWNKEHSDILYSVTNIQDITVDEGTDEKSVTRMKVPKELMSKQYEVWEKKKRFMMIWQDDKCDDQRLTDYVTQVKKIFKKDVDTVGKCFKTDVCSLLDDLKKEYKDKENNEDEQTPSYVWECFEKLSNYYLLVMVPDVQVCSDYVSNKLLHIMQSEVIPVVIQETTGKVVTPTDVNMLPSNHSVILTSNYKSPQILAKYLNLLSRNFKEYNKYFTWKKTKEITSNRQDLCTLCSLMHDDHSIHQKGKPFNMIQKQLTPPDRLC